MSTRQLRPGPALCHPRLNLSRGRIRKPPRGASAGSSPTFAGNGIGSLETLGRASGGEKVPKTKRKQKTRSGRLILNPWARLLEAPGPFLGGPGGPKNSPRSRPFCGRNQSCLLLTAGSRGSPRARITMGLRMESPRRDTCVQKPL